MIKITLFVFVVLTLLCATVQSAPVTCIENGKVHEDGETWVSGGLKKACKVYTAGQGLIMIVGSEADGAYGGDTQTKKTGPRLAIYDGKTYANLGPNLE